MRKKIEFKTMDFLSTTFWHFISDRRDAAGNVTDPALDILLTRILKINGTGKLSKDPGGTVFHPRTIILEGPGIDVAPPPGAVDGYPTKINEFSVREPKAVCFADIPFNFLPIHIDKYNGIGLGFYRRALLEHERFRPVTYFPRVTLESLRDACDDFADIPAQLRPYSKIVSREEEFDDIYSEREWRIPEDVLFSFDDLSCIVFRDDKELRTAIGNDIIKKFMEYGVSIISCDRHFELAARTV